MGLFRDVLLYLFLGALIGFALVIIAGYDLPACIMGWDYSRQMQSLGWLVK